MNNRFRQLEGSFIITITENKKLQIGWAVNPSVSICLHDRDKAVLELIQTYSWVGRVYRHGFNSVQWIVSFQEDIAKIIKHFKKFPLLTKKQADF